MATRIRIIRKGALLSTLFAASLSLGGCMGLFHRAERPPESEFGLGPRSSATGAYVATLQPEGTFVKRKLQRATLIVRDSNGNAVQNAEITIDGGMPQHGHGLPTKPRVVRASNDGSYDVAGMKFSMGGWWQLRFRIAGTTTDSVTFNIDL